MTDLETLQLQELQRARKTAIPLVHGIGNRA